MIFTIKKFSDFMFEEKRDIPSLEALMALTKEHGCELKILPHGSFDKDPQIWICDDKKLI